MKKRLLLACLTLLSATLYAQNKEYTHGVFWGRLILADTINSKFKWELYLQKRTQSAGTGNVFAEPHFLSVWPWLNYKLNSNTKISVSPVGYFVSEVFFNSVDDVKPGVKEWRSSIRLENEQKLSWFNYSNRYSVEYRLRDLAYNGNYQPNWRVRYQAKIEKPLRNVFSKDKPLSVFVSEEVFIQFGKAVASNPNIFDQNRVNIGAGYEIFKNIRFSASYLNIIQERVSGKEIDNANALWVVLDFENVFSQFKKRKIRQ
ncbi:uncharacterized protein DUF2490 [Mucilaginibacter gracilis]|uniref:Uncharacterized protein DUF2490 n=1 Tax=Mucilaginibacter gracilis TaxID=423350 RepID=A0A495IVT9_9SPHI|nr:DUF2490 domain-containing protein [Mucilaginibacter gracilis]RKR80441.1 uncharacterized protein DUF2490 [Mucilaginibacter gracilis]